MSHRKEWKRDWKAMGDVARMQTTYGETVPPGPWDNEPDKIQWIDDESGLDCLMHRNHLGAWCGYVGVPEGHPLYGKEFSSIDADIRVHGGLTYSRFCQETDDESYGICHVPEPGRPHKVWWLGFDCGHAWDLMPGFLPLRQKMMKDDPVYQDLCRQLYPENENDPFREVYRDQHFVEREVTKLARQLACLAL